MNGSLKVQSTHLNRQAIVYLRQSSPRQVELNRESAVNQRALKDRLVEMGWKKDQILVIDEDQGRSGAQSAGREGFQKLVADVGLRKVGIVMGYEVSRLSRNCADWHRLLELCGLFDTLIGDADGIYQPRDFNDRLLLGLKGTMSEAELHSLRLRLDAGRLSKAHRGELIQHLPTGYVRDSDGAVHLDPDQSIQDRIRLIFSKFLELGSIQKVLRYLVRNKLKIPRRQMQGPRIGEVLWKEPSMTAIGCILKNPAYAGAFAYGRRVTDQSRQVPGRPGTGHLRQSPSNMLALVKGVYPAFISWDDYERIQEMIGKNWRLMLERMSRNRDKHVVAPLLKGMVRCGHCGHAMRVAYKGNGVQYVCSAAQSTTARPSCQFVSGRVIDEAVVQEFFRAMQPAAIDTLERIDAQQAEHRRELLRHQEQDVARLEYAAHRTERQYNQVDPENRLIAATLEQKWEHALFELQQARQQLAETQSSVPKHVGVPKDLRAAFADLGRRLPDAWPQLSYEARRQLLHTLIAGVNLRRSDEGIAQIRIIWKGGFVSELAIPVPMSSFRFTNRERQIVARIRELMDEGLNDTNIAEQLAQENYRPCRGGTFTAIMVLKLRLRNKLSAPLTRVRQGNLSEGYTVRELSALISVDASWFYHRIGTGTLQVERNEQFGCYLFPRTKATIQRLKKLKAGSIQQLSFLSGHRNG